MVKKIVRFFFLFIGISLLVMVLIIRPYDDTPYQEQEFYTKFETVKVPSIFSSDTSHQVLVGWAKENITPGIGAPMAGYGLRPSVSEIRDSIYVRTIVFQQGKKRVVFLSYDLLMVHPDLRKDFEEEFLASNNKFDYQFYYSAIHSHSSVGGWSKGLLSKITLGGYDDEISTDIINSTINSITKAYSDIKPCRIAYHDVETDGYVKNRVNDTSHVDKTLRSIHFKRADGKEALWTSFSAHATNLGFRSPVLSADYTKGFHDAWDEKGQFSIFSAGMVGSTETRQQFERNADSIREYGLDLASFVLKDTAQLMWEGLKTIEYRRIKFGRPKIQIRIAPRWCLSQWLVNATFDEEFPVTIFSLNKHVLIGMPCDFSGELYPLLNTEIKPVITSFNGSYIGYLNHPQHYFVDTHVEVQDLAWLGEKGGYYAIEVIEKIISESK